jgi:hypothetical protein
MSDAESLKFIQRLLLFYAKVKSLADSVNRPLDLYVYPPELGIDRFFPGSYNR